MTKLTDKQKSCPHSSWSPVEGEFGAYQCQECEAFGYKVGVRRWGHPEDIGKILPWADGKLHYATSRGKLEYGVSDRPKDLTNPKLRSSPQTKRLGQSFIEPPPEKNR